MEDSVETCPECGTALISGLSYPHNGVMHESRYCPRCDEWVPEPRGRWTKWKPKPSDFFEGFVASRRGGRTKGEKR